ncbi:uncharacterized protein LOC120330258 [Styela clava]|uniref:uncharacterized protein LOC120330258 n=1 Tax=Styela clava TaxID=7725 RepID=UPI00193A3CBD|nr:uncharacterized protein LOC120330258 [Styela clava]
MNARQNGTSFARITQRSTFSLLLCLLFLSIYVDARTYQNVDPRKNGKAENDDGPFNTMLRRLQAKKENGDNKLEDINGVHEAQIALNKLLQEFKQLQKDLEYCKSVIPSTGSSSQNLPSSAKSGSAKYSGKEKQSRINPFDSNVNDIVSDEDDKDSMKIAERNYYGWMDFGK